MIFSLSCYLDLKMCQVFLVQVNGDFAVSYCHLSQALVTEGYHIRPGTIIALTGNSGRSTGPHLHLTLKKDGKNINPAIQLNLIKQTSTSNMFAENTANPGT